MFVLKVLKVLELLVLIKILVLELRIVWGLMLVLINVLYVNSSKIFNWGFILWVCFVWILKKVVLKCFMFLSFLLRFGRLWSLGI